MTSSDLVGCSTGISAGFALRKNFVDKVGGASRKFVRLRIITADGSPQVARFDATTYGTLMLENGPVHSIKSRRSVIT